MIRRFGIGAAAGLTVVLLITAACGDDKGDSGKESTGTTTKYTFATDIAPLVKTYCTDSGCHGKTGASSKIYEDSESNFKGESTMVSRLNSDMPRGKTMSSSDKQKLIDFYGQK